MNESCNDIRIEDDAVTLTILVRTFSFKRHNKNDRLIKKKGDNTLISFVL